MARLPLEDSVKILIKESFIRRRFVVTMFFLILAAALAAGWHWPKSYSASATIFVEERNIIQPLMQGAAVTTDVAERARLAAEVIQSRRILGRVVESLGGKDLPPLAQENMIEQLRKNSRISMVGTNLIKIEHRDPDPERAYQVTKNLVDFFIAENQGTKARESESAFNFIDAQVKEYEAKLAKAEAAIKQFRTGAFSAPTNSRGRTEALRARLEQTQIEIKEAEMRRESLERQLAGETMPAGESARQRRLQARLQELEAQLSTLRQTYRDTYPDIGRLKGEIEEVRQALANAEAAGADGGGMVAGDPSTDHFRNLVRQDLSQTQTQLAALRTRLAETQRLLESERETGQKVYAGVTLAELMRDYEVNQGILDDLLRRREAARVSMSLDRDREDFAFRVHDEPTLPLRAEPPRFVDFAAGGLLAALVLPFGMIYAKQQMDARVRSDLILRERLGLPVVAAIPHLSNPEEAQKQRRGLQWLAILAFSIVFIVLSIVFSGELT